MCTAVAYKTNDFYFGRTLDIAASYGEEVTITPRNYPFKFLNKNTVNKHYAMIGMAHISDYYPLYYDAVNEKGLAMAALNFVGNAYYRENMSNKENIAQYEFINWILCQCDSVESAKSMLERINITGTPFNESMPVAKLHWMISDKIQSITVESVKDGIKIYDNSIGILTNNPPFDEQMFNLNNYMNLSVRNPKNNFSDKLKLNAYSFGMGALGLPGDLSSQSRFVRAAFVKLNSFSGESESESVNQFFHILGSVNQQRGCCEVDTGKYEISFYMSCCNTDKGIYYYTTYENHQITAIDMNKENIDGENLIHYPLIKTEQIRYEN